MDEGLSLEDQKLLTEWLGECWHENGRSTGMNCRPFRCKYCDEPLHREDIVNRLDFSDWRVVGMLIDKLDGKSICVGTASGYGWAANFPFQFMPETEEYGSKDCCAPTPQLAICRAVLAYLQEGEK